MPRTAEALADAGLVGAAGGESTRRSPRGCELNGGRSDAAGAAVDQDGVAGLATASVEQVGPHRKKCLRYGRRLDHAQVLGNRQAQGRRRHRVFGISAARQQGGDLVSERDAGNAGTDRDNFPGDLESGNVGRAGRRRVAALALRGIGPVHAGRGDAHEHFALSGFGRGTPGGFQLLRAAGRCDLGYGHFSGYVRHGLGVLGISSATPHRTAIHGSVRPMGRAAAACLRTKDGTNGSDIVFRVGFREEGR